MYTVFDYGRMIADRIRVDLYIRALRQSVKPGSVVVDIGTGTGLFALLACRFGARRVFAIEPTDAIQVAREMAFANGYAERIEYIQDISTRVTLPEQAHVIVSDLHGVLPLFEQNVPSLIDARCRLLAPGWTMIPQQETLRVAVVEVPELYNIYTKPWDDNEYGFNMQAAIPIVTNTWSKRRFSPSQLLVAPQTLAVLDYGKVESPNITAQLTWNVASERTGYGIAIWFDATLVEDLELSNAPGEPELSYGNAFFPWSQPVALVAGDTITVTLRADLIGEDYHWRWDTRVLDQGDPQKIKADFKQSTFYGAPLSPAQLSKQADTHVPILNEDGEIDRLIIKSMDGRRSLGEIASLVSARYPSQFPQLIDALTRVGEISKRYSQ